MKKLFFSVAAICLLSAASYANGGKSKATKHAIKKEAKISKKVVCGPECPSGCPGDCCKHD